MYAMKMADGGRVVVPAEIRKALELDGDTVPLELVDGEARLTTQRERLRRAQALIERYCPKRPGESIVDELTAERRAEAMKP